MLNDNSIIILFEIQVRVEVAEAIFFYAGSNIGNLDFIKRWQNLSLRSFLNSKNCSREL
jgi:hypothetical protein